MIGVLYATAEKSGLLKSSTVNLKAFRLMSGCLIMMDAGSTWNYKSKVLNPTVTQTPALIDGVCMPEGSVLGSDQEVTEVSH